MFVPVAMLMRHVILERGDKRQILLCACHGDVQKPSFLFDHLRLAGRKLRRKITIGNIQHVHGVPLLTFR